MDAATRIDDEHKRITVTHDSTRSNEPQQKSGYVDLVYIRDEEERINFTRDDGQPMSVVRENGEATKLFTAGSWRPYCGDVIAIEITEQ